MSTPFSTSRGLRRAIIAAGAFAAALGFDRPGLSLDKQILFGIVAALGLSLAIAYGQHWLILLLFVSVCGMAVYAGEEKPTAKVLVQARGRNMRPS